MRKLNVLAHVPSGDLLKIKGNNIAVGTKMDEL